MNPLLCLIFCFISLLAQICWAAEPADLALVNGKIITLNSETPQAEALAVRHKRIVAVGSDEEIRSSIGPSTHVVDLEGNTAVHGFIDSHAHLTGVGEAQWVLNCRDYRHNGKPTER